MAELTLSPAQEAEAQRLLQAFEAAVRSEGLQLARLLASKPDAQLLGATEFQLRDGVHRLGAQLLTTALDERKKGGAVAPAPTAPAAKGRPAASASGRKRSSRCSARSASTATTTIVPPAATASAPATPTCA